jgi:hypothetical protein
MQVMTSGMSVAWDWKANAMAGRDNLDTKFEYVRNVVRRIRKLRPGLRQLSGLEWENMALMQYGDSPANTWGELYYVAACNGVPDTYKGKTPACEGNAWDWVITTKNGKGVKYVEKVRGR